MKVIERIIALILAVFAFCLGVIMNIIGFGFMIYGALFEDSPLDEVADCFSIIYKTKNKK